MITVELLDLPNLTDPANRIAALTQVANRLAEEAGTDIPDMTMMLLAAAVLLTTRYTALRGDDLANVLSDCLGDALAATSGMFPAPGLLQ